MAEDWVRLQLGVLRYIYTRIFAEPCQDLGRIFYQYWSGSLKKKKKWGGGGSLKVNVNEWMCDSCKCLIHWNWQYYCDHDWMRGFKNQWSTLIWSIPWSTLGALLEYSMEYFWGTFRALLEYFWSTFGHFGVLLGHFWSTLHLHGMIL